MGAAADAVRAATDAGVRSAAVDDAGISDGRDGNLGDDAVPADAAGGHALNVEEAQYCSALTRGTCRAQGAQIMRQTYRRAIVGSDLCDGQTEHSFLVFAPQVGALLSTSLMPVLYLGRVFCIHGNTHP